MEEELGGTFVVSVDELGLNGLWSTIKDLVESRMPLQGLILPNKVGKPVGIPKLPLLFVLCTDKRLLHLKQFSHSPVTWFRNPITHLVLVSTADVHEYKSTTRAHIKRVTADIEKDWGGGNVGSEWLILYVRPFELEAGDRGAKKVFEKLCDDFGSKRRERVVRLDVPLRAFDGPASSISNRLGGTRLTAAGTFVGPGGPALSAGLDDICAGLRDSIRAAYEARKAAYEAEVRKLHNDRREPGWSFTMLYLVKDSAALMLEGAGLWEDAFQEYVELETVYMDCIDAAAQGSAHSGGVGSHADFGVTGRDAEDVATLLSSSWRKMRSLVLQKRNVQEFQFRQYLFAAQARVLLRLNRPVDVTERGLVFVQNFLTMLAAKEAAGLLKPWFKECWAFSACVSLITAVTSFMRRCHEAGPADWDVPELLHQGGPSSAVAQAALRQLAAEDRSRQHPPSSPLVNTATGANIPVLPASAWQIGAIEADTGLEGGTHGASSSSSGVASTDEEMPALDLALLCGRAILPGNLALLLQEGDPRRELMDKLYCCLLGHLYHLARGELLRLGNALQLPEAAAANASILQLGKAAFSPNKPATTAPAADSSKSPRSPRAGSSPVKQPRASAAGQPLGQTPSNGRSNLTAGVELLLQASASGVLSPRMVAQLQELLMTPLCGFSMMINKYADGSSSGLTYEVHTPRLEQDPLGAALHRADSQSTPYLTNNTTPAAATGNSPRISTPGGALSPFGRSGSSSTAAPAASPGVTAGAGSSSGSMLDRLRRVGSSSGSVGSTSGSPTAAAASGAGGGAGVQQSGHSTQQQSSRLSKVTGDMDGDSDMPPAAIHDGSGSSMRRQDSSTSLATVNIGASSADGGVSFTGPGSFHYQAGDEGIEDVSLSGASVTMSQAASVADSASSMATAGLQARPSHIRTQSVLEGAAAAAAAGAPPFIGAQEGATLPRVATHARSASALPATVGGEQQAAAAGSPGAQLPPSPEKGLRSRRQAAPAALQPNPATAAAAAAVPGWVGEWRLQLALRSPACFQELVLALSQRAAWCYAKSGRVRSSALLCADVAVLALQRGQLDTAASLLDRMHHIFACEGWQQLLGALLPKLLACQSLAAQPMLPFTALRLLALKPGAAAAADRQAAFEELLAAVGASSPSNPSAGIAGGPGGVTAFSGSSSSAVQLATSSAIQMRPAPGTYSHFFGSEALQPSPDSSSSNSRTDGQSGGLQQLIPVLSPPARPVSGSNSSSSNSCSSSTQQRQRGAALLVVGDSLPLAVDVISRLPAPVLLQRPVLSLVQLHKSSWVSSTASSISTGGSASDGFGSSPRKGGRSSQPSVFGRQGQSAAWDASRGDRGGLLGSYESPRDELITRWQEGEELVATKLLAGYSPAHSSAAGGCSSSNGGSNGGSDGCKVLPDGSVLLVPGVNRLVFRVAPVQSGLYCLKQLRAVLGTCGELIIGLPPPGSLSLLATASDLSRSCSSSKGGGSSGSSTAAVAADPGELPAGAGGAGGSDVVQTGGVTSTGQVVSEVVVARVVDPEPRVKLEPVVPDGSLPVGTTAWLGLLVTPLQHHTLIKPRLHLQPNKHLALVATVAPGGGVSGGQQQQQQQLAGLGLAASSSSSEQQQMLLGGPSASTLHLTAASTSSSSVGGHPQQQLGHYVYVMPLQQQQQPPEQQQQQGAAAAGDSAAEGAGSSSSAVGEQESWSGQWLPLRRGGVDLSELLLPDSVLRGPLLVWMQVLVGSPASSQATLSVSSLPPAPAPGAAAAAASKVVPEPCVLLASRALQAVADMLLQLEYTADAGVWRSHASCLQLPLQHPVHLTATALQLPSGAVALSITLSLDPGIKTAFVLHQAGLRPQFGLLLGLEFNSSSSSGVLGAGASGSSSGGAEGDSRVGFSEAVPLLLVPGGTAGLSFLLSPDPGDKLTGSFEADGCNLLLLSYSLVPYGTAAGATDPSTGLPLPLPPPLPDSAAAAASAGGASNVLVGAAAGSSSRSLLGPAAVSAASIPTAAAGGSSVLALQLPFWLEFPSVDQASPTAASVRVTLLGPYTGQIGQAVTLSWQLARIASADAGIEGAAAAGVGQQPLSPHAGAFSDVPLDGQPQPPQPPQQQHSSTDSDELLCYELVFGQQPKQEAAASGKDGSGSKAGSGSGASAAAAAAAAADMGGLSGGANAALLWGVSGAAPSGVVRLGRAPGSLAVVEVVLLPRAAGRLVAPQLLLKSPGGNQVVLVEAGSGHTSMVSISR